MWNYWKQLTYFPMDIPAVNHLLPTVFHYASSTTQHLIGTFWA